jgi:hypothetical protein
VSCKKEVLQNTMSTSYACEKITPYPHEYKLRQIKEIIIILHILMSINWGNTKIILLHTLMSINWGKYKIIILQILMSINCAI